jgi:hypothetical protein
MLGLKPSSRLPAVFVTFHVFCWFCSPGTVPFILAAAKIMFMFSLTTSVSVFYTWYSLNRPLVFLLMTMYHCSKRTSMEKNKFIFFRFLFPTASADLFCDALYGFRKMAPCFLDSVFRPLFSRPCFPAPVYLFLFSLHGRYKS